MERDPLEIVRLGHPALRRPARPLTPEELGSAAVQELIDDMLATMFDAEGVGLAAPQVAVELRLFVYGHADGPDDPNPQIPPRVIVNPVLEPEPGDLVEDWEGCLSIPDLRGLVPRHPAVRVRGLDREGRPLEFLAEGFEARIVQHELDHLNGVIFLDRMRDFLSLHYAEAAEAAEAVEDTEEPLADASETERLAPGA